VTLCEAESEGRTRPGSRAIYLHHATLQLLESIAPGLGFAMAASGLVWPVKRTLFRGREVYRRSYPPPDPRSLPPFTSLSQVEIERHLWRACDTAGVEVLWDQRVTRLDRDGQRVVVHTERGDHWSAQYVIGADGAHSIVRHQCGIAMQGERSVNTFIVVDVAEDPNRPLPVERVFHYEHPHIDGRNVLYVPFAGGWRIDLQLYAHDNIEAFSGWQGVRQWLGRVMPQTYTERITWVSTYQFLQVVAESFTDTFRRILLVGEAAHLFAPFGARGLNSGVPDAILAARAIAQALGADTEAQRLSAIDAFAAERHRAAEYNRNAARIALEHIQGESPGMQTKRAVAALLAPVWPDLGRWLDEGPYGPRSGPNDVSTKY
jgi:3-(3-hydroxy-phenyl)propionate hydroxylase